MSDSNAISAFVIPDLIVVLNDLECSFFIAVRKELYEVIPLYLPISASLVLYIVANPRVEPMVAYKTYFLATVRAFSAWFWFCIGLPKFVFFSFKFGVLVVVSDIMATGMADYFIFIVDIARVIEFPADIVDIEFYRPEGFVSPESLFL